MTGLLPGWRMSHCTIPPVSPVNSQKALSSQALLSSAGTGQTVKIIIEGGQASWCAGWPPRTSLPTLSLCFGTLICSALSPEWWAWVADPHPWECVFRGGTREGSAVSSPGRWPQAVEEAIWEQGFFWCPLNPISEAANYATYVRL